MKKLLIVLFVTSALFCRAQDNTPKDDQRDNLTLNMAQAWLKYLDEDYRGALRIYRGLYKAHPENPQVNYKMGQCYVAVNEMDSALQHLQKALQTDTAMTKEVHFLMGKAYQYLGRLDNAVDEYYKYKISLSPKQNDRHFVNILLKQCLTAKELMANPVNVQIKNLGESINSMYTDASPSITADGKTLIFTSRRPENTGGKIEPANEEYYDDVYISTWDEKAKAWTKAVNIGPPVNTEKHDANLSISPDGTQIFLYKNITGQTKSGDIFISTKKPTGEWGDPKPIENDGVNTTYFESSACITTDGSTMYFVSEREREGLGKGDVYVSKREGKEWGKPENLGPVINTENDEIGVFIHPDGKTLFFTSNGHNTMGGYDIFMSVFEENKWSEPINLGYPINTTKDEIHFILSTDRKTAYISSDREGGSGKMDIYAVDMAYYFKNNKDIPKDVAVSISGPPLSILKGTVVDAATSEPVKANIIITDMTDNKTKITQSDEKGEYFITLPADRKYDITVKQKGFKPLSVKFKLPKGETDTYTMTKHLLLNKE